MSYLDEAVAKPRLRGVAHQFSFFVALGAGGVLVAMASTAGAAVAAAIYAVTLATMLGVSASYHRGHWRPAAAVRWRRADHAAIFVFIAGSYTPVCALGVGGAAGARLLVMVWLGATLGALRALLWVDAPRWVSAALYVGLGWLAVAYLPTVAAATGPAVLAPILAGGLLYTVGATVYALRWPDPSPRVFGYHEIFHALVVAAVICHFAAVVQLVR
ncbi:MAG: hemolysin III family protein [Kofleriaceae bacterium]|nr:hemolysin III family protein [Myxococcales bacterium]MCB9560074.1 hemolysin III family protein [Kofleriaceae bacterium]MCB9571873.1 hemolysin III family protein [Kofleriaceae bacterium]